MTQPSLSCSSLSSSPSAGAASTARATCASVAERPLLALGSCSRDFLVDGLHVATKLSSALRLDEREVDCGKSALTGGWSSASKPGAKGLFDERRPSRCLSRRCSDEACQLTPPTDEADMTYPASARACSSSSVSSWSACREVSRSDLIVETRASRSAASARSDSTSSSSESIDCCLSLFAGCINGGRQL
jgi:hypothetical protein